MLTGPPSKKRKVGNMPLEVAKPKVVHPTRDPKKPEKPQNPHNRIYAYGCSPSAVTDKNIFASLLSYAPCWPTILAKPTHV